MMKQPISLQLSVDKPCSQDWHKMTPQEQGRFCDSCQHTVIDFTGFTDEQLFRFFIEHRGQKVCGKFSSMQLNRQINIPPQPHSRLYKWIVAAGLALVFTAAPGDSAFAKAPWACELAEHEQPDDKNEEHKKTTNNTYEIKGTILDNRGNPVIGATLVFKRDDQEYGRTYTTIDGSFSTVMKKGNYLLYASCPGYNLPDVIVVRQKKIEQGERLTLTFYEQIDVLGMPSSHYGWKWDWRYMKVPYLTPPQD